MLGFAATVLLFVNLTVFLISTIKNWLRALTTLAPAMETRHLIRFAVKFLRHGDCKHGFDGRFPGLRYDVDGMPRPLSVTDDVVGQNLDVNVRAVSGQGLSIELSTISQTRWCSPLGPVEPMYMPVFCGLLQALQYLYVQASYFTCSCII